MKKPPCRICKSKRWKKNDLGFYVCAFGHQLEGHQEEEGEYNANAGSMTFRRTTGPKRKREAKGTAIFSGTMAEDLEVQGIQFILRKQIYIMIHDLGFPPEMEQVALEFWTLYLASYNEFADNEKDPAMSVDSKDDTTESATETMADRGKVEGEQEKSDHDAEEEEEQDELDLLEDLNRPHAGSSDEDSESSELDQGDNNDKESSDSEGNDPQQQSSIPSRTSNLPRRSGRPTHRHPRPGSKQENDPHSNMRLNYTLAICFLSAHWLKIPIVWGDIQRWVSTKQLVYIDALHSLPKPLRRHLGFGYQLTFLPHATRIDGVFESVSLLSRMFAKIHDLQMPSPNVHGLVFRFLQELMLPIELYPCAVRLFHTLEEFEGSNHGRNHQRRRLNRGATIGVMQVMGIVIMLAKLLFGLDGRERVEDRLGDLLHLFPKEQDWLDMLDAREAIRSRTLYPSFLAEVEDFAKANAEQYLEFCKTALDRTKEADYSQLVGVFRTTEYAAAGTTGNQDLLPTNERVPDLGAFIRKLYLQVDRPTRLGAEKDGSKATTAKSIPSIASLVSGVAGASIGSNSPGSPQPSLPPPLQPGEHFVHYPSLESDQAGSFLGSYERLLGYASNILCVHPENLQTVVGHTERMLLDWFWNISANEAKTTASGSGPQPSKF